MLVFIRVNFLHCRSLHVLYEKLPYDIAERHVLLMDPILASGNTCAAAIEVPFEYFER